ncbi:putative kynureninase [Coniella lustricola]|uniref:Kynureninase n=1 Tax=Coniella lustricola TaxID=2025994 RepID=A0A2T2ZVM4_9PEZI|nr:putative kynureninase [Coniella lustricola]
MDFAATANEIRAGNKPSFDDSLAYAQSLDRADPLAPLRSDYLFPTKASIKSKTLTRHHHVDGTAGLNSAADANANANANDPDDEPVLYFCGNSLGLQSKTTRSSIYAQLDTWHALGVNGHFTDPDGSPLVNWQDMSADCARKSVALVGAKDAAEIVYMNTLTVNIHMLLAAFYKPTAARSKIILEWKPFPSDYYAISSHVQWHGRDPAHELVEIWPHGEHADPASLYISTDQILATIDAHAHDAALLLLPGIQYYSGQLFDMATITEYAHARGLVVGWDLAHAAGNVDLRLHDWNVDFAMWCTYKYINAGPGAIAGAFVHERHGHVEWSAAPASSSHPGPDPQDQPSEPVPVFRPRLSGWYGGDKSVRFLMAKQFQPTPGAAGFQAGNPSALDLAALSGSLDMFARAGFPNLRNKSLVLTAYAEHMLHRILADEHANNDTPAFTIVTPPNPAERGAQLSVLLRHGLLDKVQALFAEKGIICDKRKPDVIRVAPVPMYNSFEDVWRFMHALREAVGIPAKSG